MTEKKKTSHKGSKKTDFAPHIKAENAPPCDVGGCAAAGVYKAPKSRDELHEYRWFCLDHIREHNEKWDYFAGLDTNEIEYFVKDAVTGHRPTWDRESRISDRYHKLQDALYEFLSGGKKPEPAAPPLKAKLRKALSTMDLSYPYTEHELKAQYRVMVKKHHPDLNKGDKRSEETFKQVAVAYQALLENLKNIG
jgi:hypothetical protein